jgi:hypothetical protein
MPIRRGARGENEDGIEFLDARQLMLKAKTRVLKTEARTELVFQQLWILLILFLLTKPPSALHEQPLVNVHMMSNGNGTAPLFGESISVTSSLVEVNHTMGLTATQVKDLKKCGVTFRQWLTSFEILSLIKYFASL